MGLGCHGHVHHASRIRASYMLCLPEGQASSSFRYLHRGGSSRRAPTACPLRALSASRAYWVVGLACGIAVLVWLWSERSFYRLRLRESLADFKRNWTFGKWVFASGLVWAISMNLYPWLLAAFHGTASAGVWAACLGAVALGNPAVLGVQNFLGPKIAHVYAEEGRRSLRRFVLKASIAFLLPMLLFCVAMTLLRRHSGNLAVRPQICGQWFGRRHSRVNLTAST